MLSLQMKPLATGDDDSQIGSSGKQLGNGRCSCHELLEVVEDQQYLSISQVRFQHRQKSSLSLFLDIQHLCDRLRDQFRIGDGSKRYEVDPVIELTCHHRAELHSKAGFAGTSRTCQCDQTRSIAKQTLHSLQLL